MGTFLSELAQLWRLRGLVAVLTRREVVARYQGSAAGVLWAYIQPLLTIAAYYLVFDIVFAMRLGEHAPTTRVGTYLIVGSLAWMAFCDGFGRGTSSLLDAGSLLHKNALPPIIFPARTVLASAVVFGPMLLLITLAYAPVHRFALPVISVIPLLLLQIVMTFMLAYLFGIMAAALRDTVQVVGFALQIGIFVSPVLFPITMFPAAWRWVLWINPMTAFVMAYQSVLLLGAWPDGSVWIAALAWIAGLALVLNILVKRSRDQLVDWL